MKRYCIFLFASLVLASSCQEDLEARAERETRDFTEKNCPIPVAQDIMNDSITFDKSTRTIHYFYTISGPADTDAINRNEAESKLTKGIRDATSIRKYKENGFNFAYTYFSAKDKGKKLIDITITPEMYNKK